MGDKLINVRVVLNVKIDPEDWELAFGTKPAEIPEDVKTYILNEVQCAGVFGDGEVTNEVRLKN